MSFVRVRICVTWDHLTRAWSTGEYRDPAALAISELLAVAQNPGSFVSEGVGREINRSDYLWVRYGDQKADKIWPPHALVQTLLHQISIPVGWRLPFVFEVELLEEALRDDWQMIIEGWWRETRFTGARLGRSRNGESDEEAGL